MTIPDKTRQLALEHETFAVRLREISQAISECENIRDVRDLRDRAEAARVFARSAQLGLEMQNRAAVIRLRAERQVGKLLAGLSLRGGDRKSTNHGDRLKLDDLGVSQNQSTRWQRLASVDDKEFDLLISQFLESGAEISAARILARATGNRECAGLTQANPTVGGASCSVQDLVEHHRMLQSTIDQLLKLEGVSAAQRRYVQYLVEEIGRIIRMISE